jgi:hypothetical protein
MGCWTPHQVAWGYRGRGYSSLFAYYTVCLHLSEHAAYARIEAARAARMFPLMLDLLVDGSVTLTTISLLASGRWRRSVTRCR